MTVIREDLATTLKGESSLPGASQAIEKWSEDIANSPEVWWSFYRANLMTEMAGVLFIVDIEAAPLFGNDPVELTRERREVIREIGRQAAADPEALRAQARSYSLAQIYGSDPWVLARVHLATAAETEAARKSAFLALPFDEAIADFEGRQLVSAETFDAMTEAQRQRAFFMRDVASDTIAQNAQRLLADAMQPGGTGLRAFIQAIEADSAPLGFTPRSPGYLETVYRTATATSYNAGRLRGQLSPNVIASGGIWEYLTVQDNRVRPAHAELHGSQWEIGDPAALLVYPPNGFGCRCSVLVADREDLDPARFEQDISDLSGDAITEGFGGPPTEAIASEAEEA